MIEVGALAVGRLHDEVGHETESAALVDPARGVELISAEYPLAFQIQSFIVLFLGSLVQHDQVHRIVSSVDGITLLDYMDMIGGEVCEPHLRLHQIEGGGLYGPLLEHLALKVPGVWRGDIIDELSVKSVFFADLCDMLGCFPEHGRCLDAVEV